MRRYLQYLGLLGMVALPPISAAPTAMNLGQLGARLNGTWTWNFESYQTQFSRASKQSGNVVWECHREAMALMCVETLRGHLLEAQTFAPVAGATTYSVHADYVATAQPVQALTMGANGYVALWDSKDSRGNPVHYRATREFINADRMTLKDEAESSPDNWVNIASAIETRTAPYSVAPPTNVPALDIIAKAVSGKWSNETEFYSSKVSHAGSSAGVSTEKCWRDGNSLKCIASTANRLLAESVYNYDQSSSSYLEKYITYSGELDFKLSIIGTTWTYAGNFKNVQGESLRLRTTRIFKTPSLVEVRDEYSSNGVDWITYSTSDLTRETSEP